MIDKPALSPYCVRVTVETVRDGKLIQSFALVDKDVLAKVKDRRRFSDIVCRTITEQFIDRMAEEGFPIWS